MARWVNGKLKQLGWKSIREAEAKEAHQTKQKEDHPNVEPPSESRRESISNQAILTKEQLGPPPEPIMPESAAHIQDNDQDDDAAATQKAKVAPSQEAQGFLYGIHYYASLPEQSPGAIALEQSTIYGHGEASSELPESVTPPPLAPEAVSTTIPPSISPTDVPATEYSGRNVVILEDIDAHALQLPELQNHVLLRKKTNKGPSKSSTYDYLSSSDTSLLTSDSRSDTGAVCDHGTASSIQGPQDRLAVCRLVRIQGNTEANQRGFPLEQSSGMLCWTDVERCQGGAKEVLDESMKLGRKELNGASASTCSCKNA